MSTLKVQSWKKLGLIFNADQNNSEMWTGGRTPTPLHIENTVFRIFFGSYDKLGRGSVYSLVIDLEKPTEILELDTTPILRRGKIGFFDDNGVLPSSVVAHDNKVFLYLIGFSVKNRVLFDATTGLAISSVAGEKWDKFSGPILSNNIHDPVFATSPWVIKEKENWTMWYVSCDRFEQQNGSLRHFYNIKRRVSKDGINWSGTPTISIDYANSNEYAISRPTVLKNSLGYHMYFSHRESEKSTTYCIGYAFSEDGINWFRNDESVENLNANRANWEKQMLCYPAVMEFGETRFMFYNGNEYGKSGFGLAVLDK